VTAGAPDDENRARDSGGDPVCWLPRVCPDCGLLAEDEPPTVCVRCGARLPGSAD
jgi:ribosomal protein S27AE